MRKFRIPEIKKKIEKFYDELEHQINRDFDSAIVCKKGCAYCCQRSECYAFSVEAAIAAAYLNGLSKRTRQKISERIEIFDKEFMKKGLQGMDLRNGIPLQYETLLPPCPFLIEKACAIYEVRPMICRAFISHSVLECAGMTKPKIMEIENFQKFMAEKKHELEKISSSFDRQVGIPSNGSYIALLPRWIISHKNMFYLAIPKKGKTLIRY